MQYFDLHCDTLYKAEIENTSLDEENYHLSLKRGMSFEKWIQCMAVWIPDSYSTIEGRKLFEKAVLRLQREAENHGIEIVKNSAECQKFGLILTVENGSLIGDDLNYIDRLKDAGVRMLTLTWNGENSIGGGADAENIGIKVFGRECLKKLEKSNIIIDVSHASEKLFFDVLSCTDRPIVASHSNSKFICPHRRNLTDEQFCEIKNRQGLVGLNFCSNFLSEKGSVSAVADILKHTEHFLSLGGENTISIGSDFDGADIPKDLSGIEKIENLYEEYLKVGYNEQLIQKIFYDNAHNFFSKF